MSFCIVAEDCNVIYVDFFVYGLFNVVSSVMQCMPWCMVGSELETYGW